jgi:hypothetical protein
VDVFEKSPWKSNLNQEPSSLLIQRPKNHTGFTCNNLNEKLGLDDHTTEQVSRAALALDAALTQMQRHPNSKGRRTDRCREFTAGKEHGTGDLVHTRKIKAGPAGLKIEACECADPA